MKSIMISIKPERIVKILNGDKTIEIRKTMPQCELPCKVYIYCTKGKLNAYLPYEHDCFEFDVASAVYLNDKPILDIDVELNGKVVAEFTLNKIDLLIDCGAGLHYVDSHYNDIDIDYLRANSCLKDEQIYSYLGLKGDSPYFNDGYAWHIEDLKIYDKPKELSDFLTQGYENYDDWLLFNDGTQNYNAYLEGWVLRKAPPSWCYVEEKMQNGKV